MMRYVLILVLVALQSFRTATAFTALLATNKPTPHRQLEVGLPDPFLRSHNGRSPYYHRHHHNYYDAKNSRGKELHASSTATWKNILEIPIRVDTQEDFDALPAAKRTAIVSRVSVLHLTFLSCFGPLIIRGAVRSSLAAATATTTSSNIAMSLNPWLAFLFTLDGLSWHALHNLLNDWQDLDDDDDIEDSFRLAYGCHALKQGFLSKSQFLKLMACVGLPGAILTFCFRNTVLAPAALYGIVALFFYTILFKPLALGEIVIYLVWGPLMAGFGQLAAATTAASSTGAQLSTIFCDPVVALFGLAAFGVIMGKHTDKITRSNKKTLPKLLGYPTVLFACGMTAIAPHVLLLVTLLKERVFQSTTSIPSIPLGASLAFLTLFRELPATLKVLRSGQLPNSGKDASPPAPFAGTIMKGTVADCDVDRAWPLWFVGFLGWHAITTAYLMVVGSGLEWALRAILSRLV